MVLRAHVDSEIERATIRAHALDELRAEYDDEFVVVDRGDNWAQLEMLEALESEIPRRHGLTNFTACSAWVVSLILLAMPTMVAVGHAALLGWFSY